MVAGDQAERVSGSRAALNADLENVLHSQRVRTPRRHLVPVYGSAVRRCIVHHLPVVSFVVVEQTSVASADSRHPQDDVVSRQVSYRVIVLSIERNLRDGGESFIIELEAFGVLVRRFGFLKAGRFR